MVDAHHDGGKLAVFMAKLDDVERLHFGEAFFHVSERLFFAKHHVCRLAL
jgi:hypothetical protein